MSDCKFCSGRMIRSTEIGDGIQTMGTMIDRLLGRGIIGSGLYYDDEKDCDHAKGGIMLKDGNKLAFDNSSGEYAEMLIQIHYCPFCGKELTVNTDKTEE